MAYIQSIINSGDKIMTHGSDALVRSTLSSERYLYEALMLIFKNVDISNGKLSSSPKAEEFLASLDARIYDALSRSGYKQAVKDYTVNYDLISDNVVKLHEKLGNGTIPAKSIDLVKRLEVNKTLAALTEQGMYADFVAPVKQGLYRNILFGATVEEAEQLITDYVITKPGKASKLNKYVGQVAADSLRQFDGSVNQTAKVSLSLNATQYVGSLIEDSRAQCMKWTGMSIIKDDELEEEINWALRGGSYSNKKCSGMIPGTNSSTFLILRGGYRCRHRAFPIRLVKR